MSPPEDFITSCMKNHVCLLQKSLYNLKQYPSSDIIGFILSWFIMPLHENVYHFCVYHKNIIDVSFVYLLLFMDDMLINSKSMS